MADLTIKQQNFCDKYLEHGNASKAYKESGFKFKNDRVAESAASRLLRNVEVRAYITEERDRLRREGKVNRDDLLAKASQIAFSDINEAVKVVDGSLQFVDDNVDLNQFDTLSCTKSESSATTKDGGSESSSVSISVKRSDRLKALDTISKLIGAYDSDEGDSGRDLKNSAARILQALGKVSRR